MEEKTKELCRETLREMLDDIAIERVPLKTALGFRIACALMIGAAANQTKKQEGSSNAWAALTLYITEATDKEILSLVEMEASNGP